MKKKAHKIKFPPQIQANINAEEATQVKFWGELLTKAKKRKFLLHANEKPSEKYFVQAVVSKKPEMKFKYFARVWIARGSPLQISRGTISFSIVGNGDRERKLFERLFLRNRDIRKSFGRGLEWIISDRSRKTLFTIEYVIRRHDSLVMREREWPKLQDKMIDAMRRLVITLSPYLGTKLRNKLGELH